MIPHVLAVIAGERKGTWTACAVVADPKMQSPDVSQYVDAAVESFAAMYAVDVGVQAPIPAVLKSTLGSVIEPECSILTSLN